MQHQVAQRNGQGAVVVKNLQAVLVVGHAEHRPEVALQLRVVVHPPAQVLRYQQNVLTVFLQAFRAAHACHAAAYDNGFRVHSNLLL